MTIAILGTGHMGPIIARVAVEAGYDVSIANSGDPRDIELIAQVMAPGTKAVWAAEATENADIVVLSLPVHRFPELDPDLLAGKLVIDSMNYWPPVDGVQEMFEGEHDSSSEVVAKRLKDSAIVKTLNHLGYHELDEDRNTGRALGVAGDDPGRTKTVAELIERIGYDAVLLDSLADGRLLQPGGPVFGARLTRAEFERAIEKARLS